jgi:hypothetical protein
MINRTILDTITFLKNIVNCVIKNMVLEIISQMEFHLSEYHIK